MRIGIHKVHNKFPYILRYLLPRLLNSFSCMKDKFKVYKWLWFFIEIPFKNKSLTSFKP